jgi:hypothetical protein
METIPMRVDKSGLDAAFKMLRKFGVLCRKNFWCCQTCGCHAMEQRYEGAKDDKPLGYCFYHRQDADGLAYSGRCCLAYGAFGDGDTAAIGRLIAHCLAECGVAYKWDGYASTRIEVFLCAAAEATA